MALALYRKYRPRTFAEVIGQEHVTEPLSQALRSGRLHHAYLFSGPRGCGKTSSARILARSLNCEQGPTPEPCGVCASCKSLMNDGTGSIDVIEIDAASHGGVDDARDLREKAFFAPASSRYKIYVIDEAHMVSSAGFNALLKLVEEPPEYVKFIFATTEPEKVLGTIRSRTHHYPFRLIPPAVLRPYLQQLTEAEGVTVDPAVFPLVVRAGGGSARDSLSVLDQLIAGAGPDGVSYPRAVALLGVTDVALIDEMCDALAAGDGAAAYSTIDRVAEAGHDPRRFASDLLERFRDLIVLQQVPDAVAKGLIDGPADQLEAMGAQATRLGPAQLSRSADIVHNGLVEMRGTTAPRLLLELITARMLLPGADDSHGALLQRLERMERRLTLSDFSEVRPNTATSSLPDASVDGGGRPTASVTGGAQVAVSPTADPGSRAGLSAARAAAAAASRRAPAGGLSPGQRPPAPAEAPPATPSPAPPAAPPSSPAPPATPPSAPADAQSVPSADPPSAPTVPPTASAPQAAASPAPVAGSAAPPSEAPATSRPASSGAAPVSGAPAAGQPSSTGAYDDDEWPDEPPPWDEEPTPSSRPAAPSSRPAAPSSRPAAPASRPPAPASRPVPPQAAPTSGGGQRNQPQAAPTSAQPASRPAQPQAAPTSGAGQPAHGPAQPQAAPTSGGGQPAHRPDQPQAAPTSGQPAHRPDPGAILPDAPDDGVEPVSSGAPGQLTAAAVREVWPEIIGVVGRQSKKLAALANGATVRDLDGQTVVLTFRFPAHAKMVADQPQLLVDALYEALGGRWQIRCEVSGETPGPAGGSQRGPASAASQQGGPARNGSAENSPASREPSSQPTRQRESAPQRTARSTPDDSDDWPEPAHPAHQPAADGTRPPHQAADPGQQAEGRQAAADGWPETARPAAPVTAGADGGWPETARPATAGADDGWPETARLATPAPAGVSPPAPASGDDGWPETARLGGPPASTAPEQPTPADDTAWPEPARPGNPAPPQATPASVSPAGATTDASVSHPNAGPAGSAAVPGRASAAPEAAAAPGRAAAAPAERAPAERTSAERATERAASDRASAAAPQRAPADAGRPAGRGLAAARAAAAAIANRQSSAAKPGAASKPGSADDDATSAEEAAHDPESDGSPKSFDGFDPGDEPLDDVIDEKSARQNSEQQAMDLLREAFGAEKIGETQG